MPTLSLQRQKEIDQIIENLKLKTGLSYPENTIIQITKFFHLEVYDVDLEDYSDSVDGIVKYNGNGGSQKPAIYINKRFPAKRKIFTVAHELGHYLLHHNKEKLRIDKFKYSEDTQESQEETEANYFAASLLVPKTKLLALLSVPGVTLQDVSNYFHVSLPVIQTRLTWLKTNP